MSTYETVTLTLPVENGYSFESLRGYLSGLEGGEIPKTTLRDWICDVCLLRESGVYSAIYSFDEFKCLVTWLAFRRSHSRGTAARKFREYLQQQLED